MSRGKYMVNLVNKEREVQSLPPLTTKIPNLGDVICNAIATADSLVASSNNNNEIIINAPIIFNTDEPTEVYQGIDNCIDTEIHFSDTTVMKSNVFLMPQQSAEIVFECIDLNDESELNLFNTNENIGDKDFSENNKDSDEDYVPDTGELSNSDSDEDKENKKINEKNNKTDQAEKAEKEGKKMTSRKRTRNPEEWPRNIRKKKRNLGEPYQTKSNKNIVGKSLKDPCGEKCKFQCKNKISVDQRQDLLKSFWAIGDNAKQRQYICFNTELITPKYRYVREGSHRKQNQAFYLPNVENKKIRVCKKFFMATLDVGDTMLRTTFQKRDDKNIGMTDQRGKHNHHPKLHSALKAGVRQHIESLPTVESHYLRKQTERTFIEGDLTLATLYRDYKRECEEAERGYVKKCIYDQIFNYEYNIGWYKPKKDQCSLCAKYKNSSPEERQEMEEEYLKHTRDKNLSREEKQKDVQEAENSDTKIVAVYDLQAVLSTPCSQVSDFYYKSKLSTYNLTVFNIGSKEGFCYIWSENIAKRGASEIGSCVLQFLKKCCIGKDVTFYSDNCAGQNKNKYIASLYLYAVNVLGVSSITHKFFITGHTQNEGDSMHSCIEREKKRILKAGPIFIPSQWLPIIQGAKKKGIPYKVKEMDKTEIYNLQKLSADIGNNFTTNKENEKVRWADIKILQVKAADVNMNSIIYYKYEYDPDVPFSEMLVSKNNVLRKRGRASTSRSITITLSQAYFEELKISKQKAAGFIALCNKNLIEKPYQNFYRNLVSE